MSGLLLVCCWFVVDVLLIYCWSVVDFLLIFPQQHKLMGSSAQNTSGVHWCTLVQAPGQVQRGSGEGSEGSGEGLGSFGAGARSSFPEKVPEKVWEALVQSQVRFNRVPKKVPEKVPGSLGDKPKSSSTGFRRKF